MVIYEVNLKINNCIATKFKVWLHAHVSEMLEIDGFIKAEILKDNDSSDNFILLTVHYTVENYDKLEAYFLNQATQMREDGINRFGNKFTATRRIFEIVK